MRFRDILRAELERRQHANHRYSLRRFASALGVHHATVSRILRGTRPVPARTIQTAGRALGLTQDAVARLLVEEHASAVLAATSRTGFRPDSRYLAAVTGVSLDNVNIALHALLRGGRLEMTAARGWPRRQES